MPKRIAIICNPVTENVKVNLVAENIERILKEKSMAFQRFSVDWPSNLNPFTDAWVIGGDGTLNYFINTYPDIKIPLCTFKGGSGNDLHWVLYGERKFEEQIYHALTGEVQEVDAGVCNGKLFINGVGIGFDGAIVKDLLGRSKMNGKASYFMSVLKQIVNYSEKECIVNVNGETIKEDTFMITVANGQRYGGGFKVAPKASLSDGLLELAVVGKIAPLKRIKYLPVIEKGEHLDLPFIKYRQTKKVSIKSPAPLHAHLDGEYMCSDHFEIECLPKKFLFSV